jgi:polyhydroxybutyrate depolymerase
LRTSERRVLALTVGVWLLLASCSSGGSGSVASGTSSTAPKATSSSTSVAVAPTAVATAPAQPSAACDKRDLASFHPVPSGETTVVTTSGGVSRTYLRYVPPGVSASKPLPLVFDIHGLGSNMTQQEQVSQLEPLAAKEHFVVITPQGVGNKWNTVNRLPNADVAFLSSVLDTIEATVCVDQARVYSTGYSDGGLMSSVLACTLSHRIAAVGLVSGILHGPGCAPSHPVPVMVFWGKHDMVLPYYGGLGDALKGLLTGHVVAHPTYPTAPVPAAHDDGFPPVEQVVAAWAKTDGCPSSPTVVPAGSDVEERVYSPCAGGTSIRFYVVSDGGHAWPGSAATASLGNGGAHDLIGHTTMSVDATALIWSFFKQYALTS